MRARRDYTTRDDAKRNSVGGRFWESPLSGHAQRDEAAPARLRQADDLLSAFRPDADRDSRNIDHQHAHRPAPIPGVAWLRRSARHAIRIRRAAEADWVGGRVS